MTSRVGVAAAFLAVAVVVAAGGAGASTSARQPPSGTAMYIARHDQRLCPSPRCGGYWVAIANGARTRCTDGLRHVHCYVARALDWSRRAIGDIPEGALVRGAMDSGRDELGELFVTAAYAPAGTATVSGGWYRIADNGIRCVRAPCFSYAVTPVNGQTRGPVSSLDLQASRASAAEIARALRGVNSKNGLYARGRFARTPDGGTVFRALRLYLRAPLPRA
jgi:hypothetical protein